MIHNAAVGYRPPLVRTAEGLPHVFAVNTLAPYVLTALVERPKRLVYMSSGMHRGADSSLEDVDWTKRRWQGAAAYAESKLHDVLLAFAVARRWPSVLLERGEPGLGADEDGRARRAGRPRRGGPTQAWLATSDEPAARVSGKYFQHRPSAGLRSGRARRLRGRTACWRSAGASRAPRSPDA